MTSVKDFMIRSDPIRVLTEAHELAFDEASAKFKANPLTTEEVQTCCADLRVLNKGDFKMLLKWRLDLLKAEKEYVKELRKQQAAAEGKEIPEEEEVPEEEKEKRKKAEQAKAEAALPKDVAAQLQEVRERVAVSGYPLDSIS